jgi:hypothetical protein
MSEHKSSDPNFLDRLVILASRHGATYFGWVTGLDDPERTLANCIREQQPVQLEDVRILASQLQTIPDREGNVMINNMMLLLPIDMNPRGVALLSVYPSGWYFPKDNPDCQKAIKKIFDGALQMEMAKAAADMNISIVGPGTRLPPPPGRMQ